MFELQYLDLEDITRLGARHCHGSGQGVYDVPVDSRQSVDGEAGCDLPAARVETVKHDGVARLDC